MKWKRITTMFKKGDFLGISKHSVEFFVKEELDYEISC